MATTLMTTKIFVFVVRIRGQLSKKKVNVPGYIPGRTRAGHLTKPKSTKILLGWAPIFVYAL